jgi:hypothetical protein
MYSCSKRKQLEPLNRLYHQTIDIGEYFIGSGGFLAYYQNNIIGLDMSQSMQPFFCLKSNDASQTFFYFGNRGQGPNDFLMPYSIQYINSQTIGVFDLMSNFYAEFNIPDENGAVIIHKKLRINTPRTRIIQPAWNQYIGLSMD